MRLGDDGLVISRSIAGTSSVGRYTCGGVGSSILSRVWFGHLLLRRELIQAESNMRQCE